MVNLRPLAVKVARVKYYSQQVIASEQERLLQAHQIFLLQFLQFFSQDFIFKFDIGLQTLQDDLEEMLTNVPSSV